MSERRRGAAGRRSDDGAVLVEAALGIPILLMFMFALVDIGMWSLNVNQATNAARDGARVAILDHHGADVPGSEDRDAVIAGIQDNLTRDVEADQVTVECIDDDGVLVPGGCAAAEPRVDRVRVQVEWDWHLVTPIAAVVGRSQGAATGTSTMEIIGRPGVESDRYDTTAEES